MNFYSIYESIQRKSLNENTNKVINSLAKVIRDNPELNKQLNIFESILNKKTDNLDEAFNFVSQIEEYCQKLDYKKIEEANKALINYFNIKKPTEKENIHEAIDDMIRYNSGAVYDLSKGKSYRKIIFEHITESDNEEELSESYDFKMLEPASAVAYANKLFEDKYNTLNREEKIIFETIKNKNKKTLSQRLKVISKKSNLLSGKEKELVESCIKSLNNKIEEGKDSFENISYETFSLLNETINLCESKFGPGTQKKVPDLSRIKNIVVSCSENKNKPDEVTIEFEIFIKFNQESDLTKEVKEFEKEYYSACKKIISSVITKHKNNFKSNFIFDGVVPTTGLKSNKPVKVLGEIRLDTTQSNEVRKFDDYVKPAIDLLIDFEKGFVSKFKDNI